MYIRDHNLDASQFDFEFSIVGIIIISLLVFLVELVFELSAALEFESLE